MACKTCNQSSPADLNAAWLRQSSQSTRKPVKQDDEAVYITTRDGRQIRIEK